MHQAKFSIEDVQISFLNDFSRYGFKDKSSMVREAIDHFKRKMDLESLKQSADLYAETFEEDGELADLTEGAITGWPE